MKEKIAVVGAGIMGLTLAYELTKKGYAITIFEADDRVGGMSACFDFDGLMVERYYHFFCKPDTPVFQLLEELNIYHHLKWKETRMGFFYEGKLYKWGNPLALLLFPHLNLISKFRFGIQVFLSAKRNKWAKLDRLTAIHWTKRFVGEKAYNVLWDSLLQLKFHEFKYRLSAAWVWRRLRRVGRSRKNIFKEKLAYLEGGVRILLKVLQERISEAGGFIYLESPVSHIHLNEKKNRVTGITAKGKKYIYDKVITTIPLPYIPLLTPQLPDDLIEKYRRIDNIGVVCVLLKLSHPLTENFWLNINDHSIELPGVIEFSNLNPLPGKLVYFPFYLHHTHEKFSRSDQFFIDSVLNYCNRINPDFDESWVLAKKVQRYEYAQPVCTPGFLDRLPPINTKVEGLYVLDTSYYYPEDRSISESIRAAMDVAEMICFSASGGQGDSFRENRPPGPPTKAFD